MVGRSSIHYRIFASLNQSSAILKFSPLDLSCEFMFFISLLDLSFNLLHLFRQGFSQMNQFDLTLSLIFGERLSDVRIQLKLLFKWIKVRWHTDWTLVEPNQIT